MKRSALSKKTRFNVFKRDLFTCQYCGKKSPDVILEVDHIKPICDGGDDNMINLITSCFDCNRGKSGEPLGKNSELEKQEGALSEQFQKMQEFIEATKIREKAMALDKTAKEYICNAWSELCDHTLSATGAENALKLVKKYGFENFMDAMQTSLHQYYENTVETAGKAFDFIGKILKVRQMQKENPAIADIYYIRGIIVKRFPFLQNKKWQIARDLKIALENGYYIETLKDLAKNAKNYTEYRVALEEMTAYE